MEIPILRLEYSSTEIEYIKNGVEEILKSGYLTMATKVKEFEGKFAKWCGVKYAIGTNSGTSSLEIPLRIVGVEGKTVICPSNTYMATPIAAVHAGAKVAFTETLREDLQMSPASLRYLLEKTPNVAAVIVVHIGGSISSKYWEIKEMCDNNSIPIIEDAAHAHGATIDGKLAGTLGLAGSFSFYPTKVLNAAEGGIVTTDSQEVFEKGVVLREHGKANPAFNRHTEFGYNWRFSEFHALLGLQQMIKADKILGERRKIAALYDDKLKNIEGIHPIKIPDNIKSAYYKYIALLDERIEREKLKKELKEKYNIALSGEVYSDPCHNQPVFKKYPHTIASQNGEKFPVTEYVCKHHICLPLYPGLKDEEVEYVVNSLKECIRVNR